MSQTPTPRPPGSRGDVVEERIDHDNAREFAKQYERNYPSGGRIENLAMCYLALPATESAQSEEDRTEAWIHSPERESPPVEAEEEPK